MTFIKEIFPIIVIVVIIIGFVAILTQKAEITKLNLPEEKLFQKALEYHGVNEAYFNINASTFYFIRDGKKCLLFSYDCKQWIIQEVRNDTIQNR